MEKEIRSDNPLGYVPENKLLRQFAIPSIIAMLVSSLYNIVDQFFIGNAVGELGNAATNIAFPLNTSCVAIALLMGIGGASTFNLAMGRGDSKGAGKYIGNSATVMLVLGVVLSAVTLLFLAPLLRFFGSPEEVLPIKQHLPLPLSEVCQILPFLLYPTEEIPLPFLPVFFQAPHSFQSQLPVFPLSKTPVLYTSQ